MNKSLSLSILMMMMGSFFLLEGCKKHVPNPYYYNQNNDVVAPIITPSVPYEGQVYSLAQTVHLVGTVTDQEIVGKSGSLKTFMVLVEEIDPATQNVINTVKNVSLGVDGLSGYTYNQKFDVPMSGAHQYKATFTAKDYAGRTTIVVTNFGAL